VKEGDNVLLRGMYNHRPVYVQSCRVVKDTPEETALFIWPGAECVAPAAAFQIAAMGHGTLEGDIIRHVARWKGYVGVPTVF